MRTFLGCLVFTFSISLVSSQGTQTEIQQQSTEAPYGFIEYLPEGYQTGINNYPLVVFLHGLGETGNGNSDLSKLMVLGPHKLIENGTEFEAIILSPQSVSWWDIAKIDEFVEWAFDNYRIDAERFYMTGLSMGGGGTWLYARDYPEKLAAIVPICGAADVSRPEELVNIPIWAFHNEGDPVVDVQQTFDWINGIRSAGGSPKLTIYQSNSHDAWTVTYNNEEMWEWMFSHILGTYVPEPLNAAIKNSINDTLVYPNPFTDQIIITAKNADVIDKIQLLNLKGKVLRSWENVLLGESSRSILSIESLNLKSGVYFLHQTAGSESSVIRLIKD